MNGWTGNRKNIKIEEGGIDICRTILRLFIPCIVVIIVVSLLYQLNAHYCSHMNVTYIAPTCSGTNAPSSGSIGY
jgi:hypothetical protein